MRTKRDSGGADLRAAVAALALLTAGCSSLISSAASGLADNLSTAILNQPDPATVRDGAPSYLLLLDSFVESDPRDADILEAAASLYTAYGAIFAEDEARAKRLTSRALDYGERALCARHAPACDWDALEFDAFTEALDALGADDAGALYTYSLSWLAWIRAHADDWNAFADLPAVEATLKRVQTLDPTLEAVSVNLYLGVLNTLRPPALGGKPEVGREYFERAIELSDGRDLGVKVEFARQYARLLYDRELHDRLLNEVVAADPEARDLTLMNVLAQEQAHELLAAADDYF
ncbi:MAG: TRAP transporter TatT component family protein [Pseudomonadota bacterium]